jgi:hypothetical protein
MRGHSKYLTTWRSHVVRQMSHKGVQIGQRDSRVTVGMFNGRGSTLVQFRRGPRLIFASGAVGLKPRSCKDRLCEYLAERRVGRDPDLSRNPDLSWNDDDNPSRSSVASTTPAAIFHAATMSKPKTISITQFPWRRCRTHVKAPAARLGPYGQGFSVRVLGRDTLRLPPARQKPIGEFVYERLRLFGAPASSSGVPTARHSASFPNARMQPRPLKNIHVRCNRCAS